MTMTMEADTARTDLAELERTADRWRADAEAKRTDLRALEESAGEAVLADESAAERLTKQMTDLHSGIVIAERAVETAGQKLDTARRALLRSRAVELRDEAAKLDEDATERQKRTDAALAELCEFEGVAYSATPVYSQVTGREGPAPFTHTETMRSQAEALRTRAAELDQHAETADATAVEALARRVPATAE